MLKDLQYVPSLRRLSDDDLISMSARIATHLAYAKSITTEINRVRRISSRDTSAWEKAMDESELVAQSLLDEISFEFADRMDFSFSQTPFEIFGLANRVHFDFTDRVLDGREFDLEGAFVIAYFRKKYPDHICLFPEAAVIIADDAGAKLQAFIDENKLNLKIEPITDFPGFDYDKDRIRLVRRKE